MIVTARRMPVPEPIAPIKSAMMVRAPMQTPPNAAAVGIYLLSNFGIESYLCPSIMSSFSISYLATSFPLVPDTSIQILEKKAQHKRRKMQ